MLVLEVSGFNVCAEVHDGHEEGHWGSRADLGCRPAGYRALAEGGRAPAERGCGIREGEADHREVGTSLWAMDQCCREGDPGWHGSPSRQGE